MSLSLPFIVTRLILVTFVSQARLSPERSRASQDLLDFSGESGTRCAPLRQNGRTPTVRHCPIC